MKHKDKKRMARKMLTKKELKAGVSIFGSNAWQSRVEARDKRVRKNKEKK